MCESSAIDFCKSLFIKPCSVLVAVSGGSDSVALLHILHSLKERLSLCRIGVAHVNHGLRGDESDAEEQFVRGLADRLGCKVHVRRLTDAPACGVEQWARKKRYEFFQQLRAEYGYDWIATGHTQNDQTETVLMRLMRGAGITGLQGIHPVRGDGVIRPLLSLDRDQLRGYLQKRSMQWCEDSSNQSLRFDRNRVRHVLIPAMREQNPHTLQHIAAVAQQARDCVSIMHVSINNWIKDYVVTGEDHFRIRKDGFSHSEALVKEACAKLLRYYGLSFSQAHIHKILQIRRRSGRFLFPSKWVCFPMRRLLLFCTQEYADSRMKTFSSCRIQMPGTTRCDEMVFTTVDRTAMPDEADRTNTRVYLDAAACGNELTYRPIREDDYFIPLGSDTGRNVYDFLKSRQVPAAERNQVGVVVRADDTVVWIPTVEISQKVRVRRETKSILEISCRYESLINVF